MTPPNDGWYVEPTGGGESPPLATVTPIRRVVFEELPEEPEAVAETASEKAAARRADRAANVSMTALTRRGMSRWELEQILVARDLDPDEVEAELDRLAGVGLIDDAALAETIVRTQHERKGLGRSALVAEMRRRHIDPAQIEESLEQLGDDSELERAKELAHKRAPQLRSLDQTTAKRRLTAFLMRKGYPSSVIRTAVDEALDAGGSAVRFR
ncbi:regulatory protein [Marisediminicola sp. UYEF4]|uniref:regulatory protein RecX n=1 Tax=Marisediminicola sp. UYEF4 TaxID=1756384 RepID=UPI00339B2189